MMTQTNMPANKSGDDPVFGLDDLLTILRFVLNAVLRHKLAVIICFVLILAAAYGVVKVLPRTYQVHTEILAHPSSTISRLADTGRTVGAQEVLFGITQMMKSRSNLEGIVDEADLVKKWKATRQPSEQFFDKMFASVFGPPTDEDIHENLIDTLDENLAVSVAYGQNVIAISVEWNNPWIAQEIQKVIINRFFEERRSMETAEITDTIQLLEGKYDAARAKLDKIAERNKSMISKTEAMESQQSQTNSPRSTRSHRRLRLPSASSQPALSDSQREEYNRASQELESINAEIDRLTESHNRRLASERQELSQLAATVGPQHPERIERERYIELLMEQSPIPEGLRKEKRSLEAFIDKMERQIATAADAPKQPVAAIPRPKAPEDVQTEAPESSQGQLAELEFETQLISEEYSAASRTVNRIEARLANARMELTATEAAFAYRYNLTRPPAFPRRPIKPKGLQIMIMALGLSIFLGVFMAVFIDLRSGIILESWQVEKIANVPLLGEIKEQ